MPSEQREIHAALRRDYRRAARFYVLGKTKNLGCLGIRQAVYDLVDLLGDTHKALREPRQSRVQCILFRRRFHLAQPARLFGLSH